MTAFNQENLNKDLTLLAAVPQSPRGGRLCGDGEDVTDILDESIKGMQKIADIIVQHTEMPGLNPVTVFNQENLNKDLTLLVAVRQSPRDGRLCGDGAHAKFLCKFIQGLTSL